MRRQRISLNGTWSFGLGGAADGLEPGTGVPEAGDRSIQIPRSYQSSFPELFSHTGYTIFLKSGINVPGDWLDDEIVLRFDAVNYWCEVWVNGVYLGNHEGGYTPFEFSVSQVLLSDRTNEVAVRVLTPSIDDSRFPFIEIPHGKQDWYGPAGGIWQDVYLERRHSTHIETVYVTPDIIDASIHVTIEVSVPEGVLTADLKVFEAGPEQGEPITIDRIVRNGTDEFLHARMPMPNPRLWSPESPHLYTLKVILSETGVPVDELAVTFGMRSVENRDGTFYLNGRPYYVIGALDQDFYPDTGYTPPSQEYLEDQFRKAKEMGLNLLRCHIKVPHPMYFEVADRIGMLLWWDLPNWGISSNTDLRHRTTDMAIHRGMALMAEAMSLDHNHPSVVIRSIVNENWGPDLVGNETHRRWLVSAFDECKKRDPTRLLVDNSACCDNFHVKTDIEDFHTYFSMPDHRDRFESWLRAFSGRPEWTFHDSATVQRTGKEILMLSEFGNWGLPALKPLHESYGGEPDWYKGRLTKDVSGKDSPAEQDRVVDTSDIRKNFENSGLTNVFRDFDDYAVASQAIQFQAVQHQVNFTRRAATIQGYVITELTDLHWEANGMLDFARNPKSHFPRWREINSLDLVIPEIARYSVYSGETVTIPVYVSHYSDTDLDGSVIEWTALPGKSGGRILVDRCPTGSVIPVGTIECQFSSAALATTGEIRCTWIGRDGRAANSRSISIGVYGLPDARDQRVSVSIDRELPASFPDRIGATIVPESPRAEVSILHCIPGLPTHLVRSGIFDGISVCVISQPGTYRIGDTDIEAVSREGVLSGDWATNNNWISPQAFPNIPCNGLLGFECEGIASDLLIAPNDNVKPLAGMVLGWAYNGGSYVGTVADSDGRKTIITTVSVSRACTEPAVATFVHDLIRSCRALARNLEGEEV
jgi:hypothetical protein